jgi:hypothetical protein
MKLTNKTVLGRLSAVKWFTAGQVTDDLRQCGPMVFQSDAECREFRMRSNKSQYQAVYHVLMRMKKAGMIDCVLGDDSGHEVRVFRLFG